MRLPDRLELTSANNCNRIRCAGAGGAFIECAVNERFVAQHILQAVLSVAIDRLAPIAA